MRKLEEWVEYMEGECNENQLSKLGLLVKHSIADQVVLDNLRRLRRMIKASDPAEAIESYLSDRDAMADFQAETMAKIKAIKRPARRSRKSLSGDEDFSPSQETYKT